MPAVVQWIVAFIGAGGLGKFVWDVVTARSQSRKNSTESTVLLVNSAAGYAESVVKRLDSINQRFDTFRRDQEAKNDAQDERNRQQDRLLLAHARWDQRMVDVLRTKGIKVEEPPPLFLSEGNTQ